MGKNRIVVDYGDLETLIFFGASTPAGELNWATAKSIFKASEIPEEDIVSSSMEKIDSDIYRKLKEKNDFNKEGFVLRFYPSNFRCKIKFEDYVRLHRIVTQISSYDIWEHLIANNELPENFLTNVPDEFYDWVKIVESDLREKFNFMKSLHTAQVNSVIRSGISDRKTMAKIFMSIKDDRINSGVLFLMADKRNADQKIWQMIKPAYSRPFETKTEEEV